MTREKLQCDWFSKLKPEELQKIRINDEYNHEDLHFLNLCILAKLRSCKNILCFAQELTYYKIHSELTKEIKEETIEKIKKMFKLSVSFIKSDSNYSDKKKNCILETIEDDWVKEVLLEIIKKTKAISLKDGLAVHAETDYTKQLSHVY
jgi:hypothetical protein